MRDGQDDEAARRGLTGWRALAGILVTRVAVAGHNSRARRLDPDDPGIVAVSDEAVEVAERAFELAEEGREDEEAVAELVRLAAGSAQMLENAERFSRQEARHREDRMFNLGQRLLLAALHGRAVEPLGEEQEVLLTTVEAFQELPADGQWAALLAREARLGDLETDTQAGAFQLPAAPQRAWGSEVLRQIARENLLERTELGDRLRAIVGPRAPTADPLLGSRAAYASALTHLTQQLPRETP